MKRRITYKTIFFIGPLLLCVLFAVPVCCSKESTQTEVKPVPNHVQDSSPTTPTQVLWNPPRFKEMQKERDIMVNTQMSGLFRDEVKDEKVLNAIRHVPRHLFVPRNLINNAHEDNPLPIGYGQTISQPYIVAYMTEKLELKPTDKMLEIGTGSGYQAAVLSELTPYVYTIEIIKPLAEQAAERFTSLGYKTIQCKKDDGYYGWKEFAPFDAIIVTAAAGHIPQPLIEQLAPGGRMIIPVGGPYEVQNLVVVTKSRDGSLKTRTLIPVRFVPLTGKIEEE
jgi:protein-L-isoaspartate(D-aspartate) O-methyltransferase